jgi:hypothetical protein
MDIIRNLISQKVYDDNTHHMFYGLVHLLFFPPIFLFSSGLLSFSLSQLASFSVISFFNFIMEFFFWGGCQIFYRTAHFLGS